MKSKTFGIAVSAVIGLSFATEAMATEWNVSLWGKRRAFTEHVEKLAELVSAKTNGEFTLNLSYGGLANNKENLDGISIGAFEMAQFCAGYHEDKNPSITVLELPFLGVDTLEKEIEVSMAVYQHPAVKEDLARWNATLLMPSPLPQYNFVGVGEPPRTLADFQGLTVRATGGIGKAMEAIGAVPTSMDATEVRQAMDSGVVKAVSFAPHAHMSFGTVENAKWWTTNLNPGTVNCPVVANTDALNALSDAERDALMSSIDEALKHYVDFYNNETMAKWGPLLDEKGIERVTYDAAALASFRDTVSGPAAKSWIEENSARGLPAQDLYDLVDGLIAK
ncbi:MAG: C4-dicarboxylate TRAP transporter substrate-binding protein [Alphaproteobacteria bacterium]|jgi:TRAP-type C4-dicarboxylate transport system substrate-binding protein|uniref:C4-dicarboxylate TRAP transporter substrate-binding protein n=1 Tax=Pacificispira sp. TaxID=2888761 RepID=UPI001B08B877|nr:C4-dicarboxylate TRAP transporter substrate-binding protein [Alphaproteobacteria bacterium]MBO6862447.1 C4-dicarboxylate TRAP transporter substrate-binding protein [Alphaproteobacteria bacterium]MEC9264857.1 C4-dicarboxylate TRAP transporter substrate-binding protein [Pseudomonadota bacterium]